MIRVRGIIIGSKPPVLRVKKLVYQCSNCHFETVSKVTYGQETTTVPKKTGPDCPNCRMDIDYQKSVFETIHSFTIQEYGIDVRSGETPRQFELVCYSQLAKTLSLGLKVHATVAIQSKGNKKRKLGVESFYLHAVGIEISRELWQGATVNNREFEEMATSGTIYKDLTDSIAPYIYGLQDVKKAMLFGGVEWSNLESKSRGDIHILLIGSPGTGKSQILKVVEGLCSKAIFTSGKGSSAVGLTVSLHKDAKGKYQIRPGAFMLANGSVVCIDEFDKMREEDRVVIHEAMEQQTISISKAGVVATLETKTSVLAAANPYMDSFENDFNFDSALLSRFDLIFLIKDEHEQERDQVL